MKDLGIGLRMKNNYEEAYKIRLPMRMPVILRIDGNCFHQFTRKIKAERPFDEGFIKNMAKTAQYLCEQLMGVQIAYIQSDEISILLHNYKKLDSEPWFGNELQKIVSISSGMASAYFTNIYNLPAVFDSRAFVLPEAEVTNYYHWRQIDATRNSISMLAQSKFSHKQLLNKNREQMQEMMFQKDGTNWNDLATYLKRGFCVIKSNKGWIIDWDIPIFTQNRDYIEKLLEVEE